MNVALRPTALSLPDPPDRPMPYVDIEGEQTEYLQATLGLTLWAALQQMENEDVQADKT